jgi:hypothetical protein
MRRHPPTGNGMRLRHLVIVALLIVQAQGFASDSDHVNAATGLAFPEKIDDFPRLRITDFTKEDPHLGESVQYKTDGINVDIYIYDMGAAKIEDGIADKTVLAAQAQALKDIQEAVKRGIYANLQPSALADEKMGGFSKEFLASSFTLDFNSQNLEPERRHVKSYLFVRGYKNNIFKIRMTCPVAKADQAEAAIPKFLALIKK